ncbi:hypothetical protein HA402_009305 [Bradysia odoriphaga]|nr:hypothetical protein HA402_009305 [Bradysia odoriphaga]
MVLLMLISESLLSLSKLPPCSSDQRQYSTVIDNLRMATKYLFHVKSTRLAEQKATARADFGGNELNSDLSGEKIIVPTKGFSAQATKCLPHASEIEIQTGPFFGGIIMTENNENCRIQGDHRSDQDRYVIRIDHDKCGSKVDHEMLQVQTFITVQENLGIFTHSTRRFVVMCSYQPDTLTVRTSFSVPSKTDLTLPIDNTTDRESRKRSFRMVGKEALLLKTESPNDTKLNNLPNEQIPGGLGFNGDVFEVRKQNEVNGIENIQPINATYDRLIYEAQLPQSEKSAAVPILIVLLTISLIMIGAFVFLVGRKLYKRRLVKS